MEMATVIGSFIALFIYLIILFNLIIEVYLYVPLVSRLGRSNLGYGSSRNTMSSQDSHGMYGERHGMAYGGVYFFTTSEL